MRLIKAILLLPYYIYAKLFERFVRYFFKIVFLIIKIAESVPIVGPKVSWVVEKLSRMKILKWAFKYKVQ